MSDDPNVILRGGPADGQTSYRAEMGETISIEDVGGGSIAYVDTGQVERRDGHALRVYAPRG